MSFPRLTLFFSGFGQSWAESYWYFNDLDNYALFEASRNLFAWRGGLLATGYTMDYARCSQDSIIGDSVVDVPLAAPEYVLKGGLFGNDVTYLGSYNGPLTKYKAAPANADVMVRVEGSDQYRVTRSITGLPLKVITQPFDYTFPECPEWAQAFALYGKTLVQEPWAMLVRSKVPANMPTMAIKTISSDVTGLITVELYTRPANTPGGSSPPLKVIISRPRVKPGSLKPNGVHTVTWHATAPTFTLNDLQGVVMYDKGGTVREYSLIRVKITAVRARGTRSRKRGVGGYSPPAGRSLRTPTVQK